MNNSKANSLPQVSKDRIKSLLTLFFSLPIEDLEITNSFNLGTKEIFIIKILEPLNESVIIVDNNNHDISELIREDILSIFSSTKVTLEVYKKRVKQTSIISDKVLLVIHFKDCKAVMKGDFLEKIMKPIIQNLNIKVNILDAVQFSNEIETLIDEIFYRLSGIPWDIDDFFQVIDNVSLQFILSRLLSEFSEDEMITLIMSLKNSHKIGANISEGAWERILEMSRHKARDLVFNRDWVEITKLQTALTINKIIREDGKNLTASKHIETIREHIMNSFFLPRVTPKVITRIVEEIERKGKLDEITKYVNRTSLAKSLVGVSEDTIQKFSKVLSSNGYRQLISDVSSFSNTNNLFITERIEFLEGTSRLLLNIDIEREKGNLLEVFAQIIPKLNYPKIYYAVNLTGSNAYLLFCEKLAKKNRKMLDEFLSKTIGPLKKLAEMFIRKEIGLTYIYGDTLINQKTKEFVEKLYFSVKIDEFMVYSNHS